MQELTDQDVIWVKSPGDDKGFGKMSWLRLKKLVEQHLLHPEIDINTYKINNRTKP